MVIALESIQRRGASREVHLAQAGLASDQRQQTERTLVAAPLHLQILFPLLRSQPHGIKRRGSDICEVEGSTVVCMLIDSVARPPVAMSWHALEPALMPPPPASARKRFSPRATQIDIECVRHLRLVSPDRAAARQRSGRAMGLCLRAWRRPWRLNPPRLRDREHHPTPRTRWPHRVPTKRPRRTPICSISRSNTGRTTRVLAGIDRYHPGRLADALARLAQVRERVCSDGTHRVESACSLLVTCQFTVFVGQTCGWLPPGSAYQEPDLLAQAAQRIPGAVIERAPASDRADQDSCCQETAAPAPASAGADRHSRRRRPRCRRAARRAEVRLGRQAPVLIGHTQDDPYARIGSSYRPGR